MRRMPQTHLGKHYHVQAYRITHHQRLYRVKAARSRLRCIDPPDKNGGSRGGQKGRSMIREVAHSQSLRTPMPPALQLPARGAGVSGQVSGVGAPKPPCNMRDGQKVPPGKEDFQGMKTSPCQARVRNPTNTVRSARNHAHRPLHRVDAFRFGFRQSERMLEGSDALWGSFVGI